LLHHDGPNGTWAELFGCAPGYLGTRLLRPAVKAFLGGSDVVVDGGDICDPAIL
jgi:hypothetical protein